MPAPKADSSVSRQSGLMNGSPPKKFTVPYPQMPADSAMAIDSLNTPIVMSAPLEGPQP